MNWDKVTPIQANTLSLGKSAFELGFSCQQRHYFRLSLPAPLCPAREEDGSAVLPRALHAASTPWAFTRVRGRFNLLPPIPIFWIWTWCCDPAGCCFRALIAVQEKQPGLPAALPQPLLPAPSKWHRGMKGFRAEENRCPFPHPSPLFGVHHSCSQLKGNSYL